MPTAVLLKDIVDALEIQSDESSAFLNLDTGQIETVSNHLLSESEEHSAEPPDLPAWQRNEWALVQQIISTDRFLPLPTKFEIHEWAIMQDFSHFTRIRWNSQPPSGRPPRRRVTSPFQRDWFKFRDQALTKIALDWCDEHRIPSL